MIKYLQLKKQSKYKINDICNKFNLESNSTLLSIYAFALAGFSKFIFTTAGQWPPQRGYFARITWLTIEFNDWESMIRSKRTLCHAILVWNHTCDFKSNECAITTLFHPCWNQIITNYQETTFYTQINFLFKSYLRYRAQNRKNSGKKLSHFTTMISDQNCMTWCSITTLLYPFWN